MQGYHEPVLLREVISGLDVKTDKWYLDCTVGDGGHSLEILRHGGRVLGLDVDPAALKRANKRMQDAGYGQEDFIFIKGNFRDLKNLMFVQADVRNQKFAEAKSNLAGAIFDLGVSSLQIESPHRGFSFTKSGPLDMRMDPDLAVRAMDLINTLSGKELHEIFSRLGEEKHSKRLADAVVFARRIRPIRTTEELASLVERKVGRREKIHPATRVFQALRIVVNDELGALEEGLVQVREVVKNGGKIAVISFHSLEDRIVKNIFKKWQEQGVGEVLTKKPIVPSQKEITKNPRSRSAKLRIFKI